MRYRYLAVAALGLVVASEVAAQDTASREPEVDLTLVGTAADDAGGGLAIVKLGDGRMQFLEPGDEIEGYTVARIEPSQVLLERADGDITLQIPGAGASGTVAAIRANFVSTLARVHESDLQSYQLGDRVLFVDATGRPQLSFPIPDELRGEEFATTPESALGGE